MALFIIAVIAFLAHNLNKNKIKPQREAINDWTEERLNLRQEMLNKFLTQTIDYKPTLEEQQEQDKLAKKLLNLDIYKAQAKNYKDLVAILYFGTFAMLINITFMLDGYSLGKLTF